MTNNKPLRAIHVLTLKSRATFAALSEADRKQFAAAGRDAFGHDTPEGTFSSLESEGMSLFKLRLARGDQAEWAVWINTAMDDGAVFLPGGIEPTGIGISQGSVYDQTDARDALCGEIEEALRAFTRPQGMTLEDVLWEG